MKQETFLFYHRIKVFQPFRCPKLFASGFIPAFVALRLTFYMVQGAGPQLITYLDTLCYLPFKLRGVWPVSVPGNILQQLFTG